MQAFERVEHDELIAVGHGQIGGLAGFAAKSLEELGYENVVSLAGGYTDWKRSGLPTELPRTLGDRIQIEQVVLNLLRNAIDAMADVSGRRELVLSIARVDDSAIELAVRDSGRGMTAAVAERVFDPFFSTKPTGLGMGLSISRSIVEAHQGRLSVSPNAAGGATFRVTLPVGPALANLTAAAG